MNNLLQTNSQAIMTIKPWLNNRQGLLKVTDSFKEKIPQPLRDNVSQMKGERKEKGGKG